MLATKRLIDTVWTLEFKLADGKLEIISYDNMDQRGYDQEYALPRMNLIENEDRHVVGAYIAKQVAGGACVYWAEPENSVSYQVSNVKHIFDYKLNPPVSSVEEESIRLV